MSEKTKIDWCDSTINFWSGCEKVSPEDDLRVRQWPESRR